MPSFRYAFRCFRFRLAGANHCLVGANYRLVGSNHRLVGANNDAIRKEQQHSSSCRAIYCPLVAIYQGQKKIVREKETKTRGPAKSSRLSALTTSKTQKKSATASRMIGRKACDRQPYAIIYKRYGSKMGKSMALQQHSERAWPNAPHL